MRTIDNITKELNESYIKLKELEPQSVAYRNETRKIWCLDKELVETLYSHN